MRSQRIRVMVNHEEYEREVDVRTLLSDFLRGELGLTGTHVGCEHGVCGACTVLLNGEPVRSCLTLAVQSDGCELLTVEGLADHEKLHSLQEAFWENHALQCGYCTPGFLLMSYWLLQHNPAPKEEEIRRCLEGNICRCTGYQSIVQAVLKAGKALAAARPSQARRGKAAVSEVSP